MIVQFLPRCTFTMFMGFVDVFLYLQRSTCRYHIDAKDDYILTWTMTIPLRLQESLRDSITSGTFVDTKFWLFSKRGSKSQPIGEPKALFVNAHVVKRVPRLSSCAIASVCLRPLR